MSGFMAGMNQAAYVWARFQSGGIRRDSQRCVYTVLIRFPSYISCDHDWAVFVNPHGQLISR